MMPLQRWLHRPSAGSVDCSHLAHAAHRHPSLPVLAPLLASGISCQTRLLYVADLPVGGPAWRRHCSCVSPFGTGPCHSTFCARREHGRCGSFCRSGRRRGSRRLPGLSSSSCGSSFSFSRAVAGRSVSAAGTRRRQHMQTATLASPLRVPDTSHGLPVPEGHQRLL